VARITASDRGKQAALPGPVVWLACLPKSLEFAREIEKIPAEWQPTRKTRLPTEVGRDLTQVDLSIRIPKFSAPFRDFWFSTTDATGLKVRFDEIRIGETYQDVTPGALDRSSILRHLFSEEISRR